MKERGGPVLPVKLPAVKPDTQIANLVVTDPQPAWPTRACDDSRSLQSSGFVKSSIKRARAHARFMRRLSWQMLPDPPVSFGVVPV